MKNKKLLITIGIIVAAVILVVALLASQYNGLVDKEANTENAKSNIQTMLQKRADLIPNLASTVKNYASYEGSTYEAVTEARSKVGSAASIPEIEEADSELTRALNVYVNAVTEAYPELKADKVFIGLIDDLGSLENEIGYARTSYNETATAYNKAVRKFPSNIFAGLFGFEKAELFTAKENAQDVPNVADYLN